MVKVNVIVRPTKAINELMMILSRRKRERERKIQSVVPFKRSNRLRRLDTRMQEFHIIIVIIYQHTALKGQ